MADLHDLTALEQARALRRGEVNATELVDHYLNRIEERSADVGAYVTVTTELAREQAAAVERALIEVDDAAVLPPLFGVPVAVKDLNNVAGVRTTFGSALSLDFIAPADDFVVTLMKRTGMPILGKTTTPEFGAPCYTEPDGTPPARTPWSLERSAGGSSGGAAAAVADGLAPLAQGSDGGGSIRIPASMCGLVGLKPARGRISAGPFMGDVSGLAVNGPLARTVADAAALLDVMAVPMPGDPHWAPPLPAGETFLDHAGRDPGKLRIGRYRLPVIIDVELHPDCIAAYEDATSLLVALGHDVEDITLPVGLELVPAFEAIWAVLAQLAPIDPADEGGLRPLTRWLLDRGRSISGHGYAAAMARLQRASRQVIGATAQFDAVLTPTLAAPPCLLGELRDDAEPDRDFENQKRFTPFTSLTNMTGQPSVSLPLYWSESGLPIGVMLAGRPADEATLIRLGAQLEAARPWAHRHPARW